ncbi:hypothetical protein Tsp_10454 [Trichinella spiralis]|uniref:hypothetical protein n=1 Tax=Trichinella spiralis TaxID=6334 RepID=UPI0001EFEE70|nr:hypothetical protein Tsp_10454 [Trichinella spiralis]
MAIKKFSALISLRCNLPQSTATHNYWTPQDTLRLTQTKNYNHNSLAAPLSQFYPAHKRSVVEAETIIAKTKQQNQTTQKHRILILDNQVSVQKKRVTERKAFPHCTATTLETAHDRLTHRWHWDFGIPHVTHASHTSLSLQRMILVHELRQFKGESSVMDTQPYV